MKGLTRVKTAALAVALSVSAASMALAQSGGSPGATQHEHARAWRGHGESGDAGIFSKLGLSDAQKAQIKQIHENHQAALAPLVQELRTKRAELAQLSHGTSFDEALVQQKLTDMAGVEAKVMGEQFKIHQETLAVLTPDQRTKLDQAREQFKSRWAERKGREGRDTVQ
jgi:protein CpxP